MSKSLNGYSLHKQWFEFAFNNPDLISTGHGAMISWFIELNNRLGWIDKFQAPASFTMAATGISSYKTYKKIFNELVSWGFVSVICESKNQFTACVIALVNFTEAKSMQIPKQNESNNHSTDGIYKQETSKLSNNKLQKKESDSFFPPDVSSVSVFFVTKIDSTEDEAERFFNYYESNGWKVGKNKMKNWQAAALNWLRRSADFEKEKNSGKKEKRFGLSERDKKKSDVNAFVNQSINALCAISV